MNIQAVSLVERQCISWTALLKIDRGSEYLANSQGMSSLSSLQTEIKQEAKGNKYFSAREGNNF